MTESERSFLSSCLNTQKTKKIGVKSLSFSFVLAHEFQNICMFIVWTGLIACFKYHVI